ncbi:efflux ABC transporter, ATP-binding protein [Roseibium sp. TrichSKD4]|uniref:ABC transporter ATP-binding protein n=1 Tax=Roseibium sp. TrichSKD4 TaxID=744980 RepID=UPI0001E5674D|nr:ABC transporter ATP-binding protein [Roseibium sp. TrichSKD4]EFO33676.1 efflux ABC transporter, ATP-binding protein [Roseibium sp. TrichSKD4]
MNAGIKVSHIVHGYGKKTALNDVSFEVESGAFCALLGPNGAGKSTLFALLTRLFIPQSGDVDIAGIQLKNNPRQALAKLGVVFQQPTFDMDLTVRRNLKYFAALHGISGRDANKRIDAALERLGMAERAGEKAKALNGGHRRRMEIARSLLHEPSVLLLDEPTVGLDAATRKSITDHVHDLVQDTGLTVLWATHLVDEIRSEDRLVVLHRGEIVADGIAGKIAGDQTLGDRFLALTSSSEAAA